MENAIKGLIVGAALGAFVGLGLGLWLLAEPLFFPGDTMLIGGISCGLCGYLWGDEFFDTLLEYWRHLF